MKKLLTTIGFSTALLIASSAQADSANNSSFDHMNQSEIEYNPHLNDHVSLQAAKQGRTDKIPNSNFEQTKSYDYLTKNNEDYNPHLNNHVSYKGAVSGTDDKIPTATKYKAFDRVIMSREEYNLHENDHISYEEYKAVMQ